MVNYFLVFELPYSMKYDALKDYANKRILKYLREIEANTDIDFDEIYIKRICEGSSVGDADVGGAIVAVDAEMPSTIDFFISFTDREQCVTLQKEIKRTYENELPEVENVYLA